ncbi:MAG: hypothetical protein C5B50_13990 [Verrucomicrobia bacterium]|nr:MAG: hypothetical protein C5B50_13990 [Verrucomicrobiota bacterium]
MFIQKLFRLATLALVVSFVPCATLQAQSTNTAATHKRASATNQANVSGEDKPSRYPYHGKLKAVDKAAKTFQVGNTVYHVSAETKISKGGKQATLADATPGEQVSGLAQKGEGDKRLALSLTIGPKPDTTAPKKKKMAEQ